MVDGILLQENGLLTKEILQNDDKKQRYGNGSEPFIQAVASRYCFPISLEKDTSKKTGCRGKIQKRRLSTHRSFAKDRYGSSVRYT